MQCFRVYQLLYNGKYFHFTTETLPTIQFSTSEGSFILVSEKSMSTTSCLSSAEGLEDVDVALG